MGMIYWQGYTKCYDIFCILEWDWQKSSVISCCLVPKNPHFPYKMGKNGIDDTGRYGEVLWLLFVMDRTLQIDNMRNRGELMEPEKLATSAVEASLAKTDRLSSFINSGDKEPCWDGNIYIHDGKNRTKKNIKKVATQVKGKFVKSGDVKDTIKYPISKNDLHAYMMNGGTVFFVVYLDKETGNTLQI